MGGPIVSPSSTDYQGEEHIAIDPNNPNFLVAVVMDGSKLLGTSGRRRSVTKYAVSLDNGATWRDRFVPLTGDGLPVTSDGYVWDLTSDPVVSIDRLGNVFISSLYYNDGYYGFGGVYVNVSTVGELTRFARGHGNGFDVSHTYAAAVQYDLATLISDDKDWIAVDNSANPATSGTVTVTRKRPIS